MMDAKYFEEIKLREKAATLGPWEWSHDRYHGGLSGITGKDNAEVLFPNHCNEDDDGAAWFEDLPNESDASFIAHARTDIPALVAEVERLGPIVEFMQAWIDHNIPWLDDVYGLDEVEKILWPEREDKRC